MPRATRPPNVVPTACKFSDIVAYYAWTPNGAGLVTRTGRHRDNDRLHA